MKKQLSVSWQLGDSGEAVRLDIGDRDASEVCWNSFGVTKGEDKQLAAFSNTHKVTIARP